MDAITAEAGVSKQTVYAYYCSKEALLTAVLSSLVNEAAGPWTAADAGSLEPVTTWDDLEQTLTGLSQQIIRSLMDDECLGTARVVIAESGSNPEYGDLFRHSVTEPMLKAVHATLRRAHRGGLIPDVPYEDVARLLVGSLLSFVLLEGLLRPDNVKRPSIRRIRRLVELFVVAVRASSTERVPT